METEERNRIEATPIDAWRWAGELVLPHSRSELVHNARLCLTALVIEVRGAGRTAKVEILESVRELVAGQPLSQNFALKDSDITQDLLQRLSKEELDAIEVHLLRSLQDEISPPPRREVYSKEIEQVEGLLSVPGALVDVSPEVATYLGATEEDALSFEDAYESAFDETSSEQPALKGGER